MKAERRHALKENTLEKSLEKAPAFFQEHGSKILLGLILGLLGYILINNHFANKAEKLKRSTDDLGNAMYSLTQLRRLSPYLAPEQLAAQRKLYSDSITQSVQDLLDRSEDPKFRAAGLVARGDLNWQLAHFPALPGSATQPSLNVERSRGDLLKSAEEAYQEVLEAPLNQDAFSVIRARFGLAYIAEDRGEWDKAREAFQKIADDAAVSKDDKALAQRCIELLDQVKKQPYIAMSRTVIEAHPNSPFGATLTPSPALRSAWPTPPAASIPSVPPGVPVTTQPSTAVPPIPSSPAPSVEPPTQVPATTQPAALPNLEAPTTRP